VSLPHHRSREASPEERGRGFGRALAEAVAGTVAAYRRLLGAAVGLDPIGMREMGRRWSDRLAADRPEALLEIAGIAAGAGVDKADLVAVNARTELLAGAGRPECSTVGVLPEAAGGACLLAQNWDWHPDIAPSRVVWTVEEPSGTGFTTVTEAGILAKQGLNDRGVGVCLNLLGSSADRGVDGIPVHVLLRDVLQWAGSAGEAVGMLERARVAASSCVTVGDAGARPRVSAVELSPGGAQVIEPDGGVLVHTNHFLAPPPSGRDSWVEDWPDSLARERDLRARLAAAARPIGVGDLAKALRSHEGAPIAVCCHDADNPRYAERQETLLSLVMDLGERRMLLADGSPCSAAYEEIR
jgi:isopenicillin-N N-acyltransferase-like protein